MDNTDNKITDAQIEEQNKNDDFGFTKTSGMIGLLATAITVLSVVITTLYKYISLGRCLYFDFDLDYYDFTLSNSLALVFLLSVIVGIIAGILSLLGYTLCNILLKYMNKKIYKIIIFVVICISYIFLTRFIIMLFIPEEKLTYQFWFMLLFFSVIISSIIWMFENFIVKKKIVYLSALIIAVLIIIAAICMRIEYDEAKNQRTFPIITENVDGKLKYYVVISKGKEKYSSYLCIIKEEEGVGELHIVTDVHKYFDINDTETIKVEFQEVKRYETTPLRANEFIDKNK